MAPWRWRVVDRDTRCAPCNLGVRSACRSPRSAPRRSRGARPPSAAQPCHALPPSAGIAAAACAARIVLVEVVRATGNSSCTILRGSPRPRAGRALQPALWSPSGCAGRSARPALVSREPLGPGLPTLYAASARPGRCLAPSLECGLRLGVWAAWSTRWAAASTGRRHLRPVRRLCEVRLNTMVWPSVTLGLFSQVPAVAVPSSSCGPCRSLCTQPCGTAPRAGHASPVHQGAALPVARERSASKRSLGIAR